MDVPDLVRQALGDESIRAGVSLGDDDAVCFTPTRTLLYRSEGLLSDESVSTFPHDFERLAVSEGRRKTKFTLTYVDREESLTVPGDRADAVLERLLEGSLRVGGALDADESVTGVFRFSELTLVVAQQRLLKHVGGYTWDGDFEAYPYDEVTGLHFEDGSVATAVVLEAAGRTERVKAPNEEAPLVRQALESALFEYFDVGSLDELNRAVAPDDEADDSDGGEDRAEGLGLDSGIDPLVDDSDEESSPGRSRTASGRGGPPVADEAAGDSSAVSEAAAPEDGTARDDELAAVTARLDELATAVERQNELLERHHQTVEQLVDELRRGR